MRNLLIAVMCVVLPVLLKVGTARGAGAPLANPQFVARVHKEPGGQELKYRLSIPKDYVAGQSRPLMLWLHGANEKGSDNAAQVNNIAGTFLGDAKCPAFVLAPQCPQGTSWFALGADKPPEMTDIAKMVIATMMELNREFQFDDRRIYIGGFSMGGGGAWELMIRYPDLFAAGLMISAPSGDRDGMPGVIKDIPLWVFHGDKDNIAPVGWVRKTMAELKAAGSKVKYTEYAGGGHDLMTPFKKEADLAEWLFAQKRATAGSFTPGKAPDNAFLIRRTIAAGTNGTWSGGTMRGKDGVPRILIHNTYYIIKTSPKADPAAVDFVSKISKGDFSGDCEVTGTIEAGDNLSIVVEKIAATK